MSAPLFDFQPVLTGTLITMRPYVEADYEALYAVASDPLIWAIHPVPERHERDVFRAYVNDALAEHGALVAIEQASGQIVGFSRYSQTFVGPDEMEIGWTFLSRHLWGGTYNRDMKKIMLAHALVHFPRVIFRVGASNLRSRGAMTKIGGQLLDWNEIVTLQGRDIPYVAFEITRAGFAVHFGSGHQ